MRVRQEGFNCIWLLKEDLGRGIYTALLDYWLTLAVRENCEWAGAVMLLGRSSDSQETTF